MSPDAPGWHSRGYLPHYDDGERVQAITYGLWDALPLHARQKLEELARALPERRRRVEQWLDAGHGSRLLAAATNAKAVVRAWQHFDGVRYELHAWCVMPTHVHVLIRPLGENSVAEILHSQKSYTAKLILAECSADAGGTPALPGVRHVWHADYHDRFIRDQRHYTAAKNYIHDNPVKAGLIGRSADWPWSSARA